MIIIGFADKWPLPTGQIDHQRNASLSSSHSRVKIGGKVTFLILIVFSFAHFVYLRFHKFETWFTTCLYRTFHGAVCMTFLAGNKQQPA